VIVMAARRGHRLLSHTADAGLEATGPDLAAVFDEAALALAGLTSDIDLAAVISADGAAVPPLRRVDLRAGDRVELAFTWLNELVARVDTDGALAAVAVESVDGSDEEGWRLRARIATLPFDGRSVRRRADVKSATYHRLAIEPLPGGGWRLTAYLDI
jgi:SHS2 domain-containing protein